MNTEFLKTLTAACAPSGAEKAMADIIEKEIAPFCDEVKYDKIGNLIARISPKNGKPEKKKMFVAHMDEVGFMVKSIDQDGRVRIALLGDVDTRTLSGRRVTFVSGAYGIVAAKPIHVLSAGERSTPTAQKSLYIELGTKDKAETEEMIRVGDYGTFEPKFVEMRNGYLAGKAIGGRSCVALLCDLIRGIKADTLTDELYFVFSVKREIAKMQFGAETAAFSIQPDAAVILDATASADFDGVKDFDRGAKCGGGVVLAPADIKTIYDRNAFAQAVAFCEENGVSFQYPATAAGVGNEAGGVHRTGVGVPSISLMIPTRNYRSGAEIVNVNDLNAAEKLLSHLVK